MTPRQVPLDPTFLRPIAHRGLHDTALRRIENTAPAFEAAIAAGYGIECDLRPASDGGPVVFHDENLHRLVKAGGPVARRTSAALRRLSYRNSQSTILTFGDLLDLTGEAVPLLVEVKSEWEPPNVVFLTTIAGLARCYRGPLALMSFDPAVIGALAGLAPDTPRGLVSGSYRSADGDAWWQDKLTPARSAELRDLNDMDNVGASFAAYEVAALPAPATVALRTRGLPLFTWTVRTQADRARAEAHADAMIFEGFTP